MDEPVEETYELYIDGSWKERKDRRRVIDPSDNSVYATVAEGSPEDMEAAIEAAERSFANWKSVNLAERERTLRKIGDLIRDKKMELSRIETRETGRPLSESKPLIESAADYYDYYAGTITKFEGQTIPVPGDRMDYTKREPVGVTGHIVPWNASLLLATRSISPALATGNSVVVKPAPEAPCSLLEFARILDNADLLPDGVVNVVTGDGERTGAALTSNPVVNRLDFTGSVATGTKVMQSAAENITSVGLELGGKSPSIVFPDVSIEDAVDGTMKIFWNAGQICFATTRVFVHSDVYDEFAGRLIERIRTMEFGPGINNPDMGPVITPEALSSVEQYVDDAVDRGGNVLIGGKTLPEEGNFYEPTVIDDIADDAPFSCEEIFGPVFGLYEFDSVDEVCRRANDTEYGLYATIWTEDLNKAHMVAEKLEAGTVTINEYPLTFPQSPSGGYKRSGFGRVKGQQALKNFTELKNVIISFE